MYSSEATGYSYKKKGRNFRLNLMDSELDKGKVAFLREDREGRTKHILYFTLPMPLMGGKIETFG